MIAYAGCKIIPLRKLRVLGALCGEIIVNLRKSCITKRDILWLFLVFVLIFIMRLPASTQVVLDWDESVYFVVAQDIARGGELYQTVWDHKGPLLYFLFVPVIKLFGNNIVALRLFTTLYLIAAMLFVYLISTRVFATKISLIPPLIYGIFFQNFDGLASNGELLMMLPALIAVYCFISPGIHKVGQVSIPAASTAREEMAAIESRPTNYLLHLASLGIHKVGQVSIPAASTAREEMAAIESRPTNYLLHLASPGIHKVGQVSIPAASTAREVMAAIESRPTNYLHRNAALFISGVFSAMAVLVKPSALFTVAIVPAALLFTEIRQRRDWRALITKLFWYVAGGAMVFGVTLAYFAVRGTVGEFYRAFYEFNRAYVSTISPQRGFVNLLLFLESAVKSDVITILACISLIISLVLLIAFRHRYRDTDRRAFYFILSITLLSLVGVYWGRNMFPHYYLQMGFPFALSIGFALSLLKIDEKYLNVIIPAAIIVALVISDVPRNVKAFMVNYRMHENDVHYRVANYITADTTAQDKIFILGGQPIIYFLANRAAPTPYFFWLYHTELWLDILRIEESTLNAFSTQPPKYIIHRSHSWNPAHLLEFMRDRYYAEKVFADYTVYYSLPIPNETNTRAANLRINEHITLEAAAVDQHRSHIYTTFIWHATAPLPEDYSISVQLLDMDWNMVAQHDGYPVDGTRPTTTWQPTEVITDYRAVSIPEDLPVGEYQLIARVYSWQTGENLPVAAVDGAEYGDTIHLGAVQIGD